MIKFTYWIVIYALLVMSSPAASPPADDTSPTLTVELSDGSRVVGKGLDDTLVFHSASMGDLKLKWAEIRLIDCRPNADFLQLTAANGDIYKAHFAAANVKVQTSFGPQDLPVKQILSVKVVTTADVAGSGLDANSLHLTVELWDGSRVFGKIPDDAVSFHSATLGDAKLPWSGISSIECAQDPKATHLRADNGDFFTVEILSPSLHLETILGKVVLPVKLISSVRVLKGGVEGKHLIGWWKLDEGSGTVAKDSSNNDPAHDGTITDAGMWTQTPGENFGCLQFDTKTQNVSLGNILQADYPEISIACWVKTGSDRFLTVWERGVWDNDDGLGLILDRGGTALFGHYTTNVRSKVVLNDNHWHHIVGTMSKSNNFFVYRLYVDGQLDNTATTSIGLTATKQGWMLGTAPNVREDIYNGVLKDFRIYDNALSPEEVEEIYTEHRDLHSVAPAPAPTTAPMPVPGGADAEAMVE